jgi:hypothetical protein
MPRSNKQIIYQGAFLYDKISHEISITEFAYDILIENGGLTPQIASEYVTKYKRPISNNVQRQNDELLNRGITIIGEINVGERISWDVGNYKTQLVWKMRPLFLKIIDSLPDDKFEALCCFCLNLMGGKVWRTKNKGDGNVDLYGIANTAMDNHIFGKNSKLRIVGQCKNYGHQEAVTSFEAFLQTMNNVRHLSSRITGEMPNEFSRENGPIFGWYVCKDGFQSGVLEEARKHGVVLSDKYDLAEILVALNLKGISSFKTSLKLNLYQGIRMFL